MSRGPRMSKAVKALIAEETINNPNKPRELLTAEIQEKIERLQWPVPADETINKMISKIRNPDEDPMKVPWDITMTTYRDGEALYHLPPDSMPAILQVWRYSVSLDEIFTKRQAKWVSVLYPFFKVEQGLKIVELWFQSRRFAREEELSLMTSIPMRLNVLAAQLVMSDSEILLMLGQNVLDPNIQRFIQYGDIVSGLGGVFPEELFHAMPLNYLERPKDDAERIRDQELYSLMGKLPSAFEIFPEIETRMVYLKHLSNMAKGTDWENLPSKDKFYLILRLRDWVTKWHIRIKKEGTDMLFTNIIRSGELPKTEFPAELYKLVGYSLEGETK